MNGKPGDHPITDIVVHQHTTWSPLADDLVREIVELGGRQALEAEIDIWKPPPNAELESRLESLRDRLRSEAKARGWEL